MPEPQIDLYEGIMPEDDDNSIIERDSTPNLLKGLISDSDFDKRFKQNYEFIFNKDVTLSFQDEKSKKEKMIMFDIIKLDTLFSTPYYEYTFEQEAKFNKMRFILDTKLDRAKGFKDGRRVNERIAQQSQFAESKQIQQQDGASQPGFLSRLLKRR